MDISRELEQWRTHGKLEDLHGHRIFVTEYGDASAQASQSPPLFFFHGFPTSSFDYARLVPLLAAHRRLVLFDFLGYGYSDKPRDYRYSLFEQAQFAEEIAERRGITEIDLMAHDMGSSVALVLLQRGKLPVKHLVLLNGSVLLKYYQPLISQRALLNPVIGPLLSALRIIREPVFARQFSKLFPTPPPKEELAAFWSLIAHNGGDRIYHLLIQYLSERKIHEYNWLAALTKHRAPLLILWGQKDPVSRPRIAEAVVEKRPDARYVPLHELGHYPQWEDPETIAKETLAFLA